MSPIYEPGPHMPVITNKELIGVMTENNYIWDDKRKPTVADRAPALYFTKGDETVTVMTDAESLMGRGETVYYVARNKPDKGNKRAHTDSNGFVNSEAVKALLLKQLRYK